MPKSYEIQILRHDDRFSLGALPQSWQNASAEGWELKSTMVNPAGIAFGVFQREIVLPEMPDSGPLVPVAEVKNKKPKGKA